MAESAAVRGGSVEANGVEFGFLEDGEGELVLLLHGFPDDAWTWSAQIEALSRNGYRAVAPFMRGYPPTEIPPDGRYDAAALAGDVAGLIRSLGEDSAYVVGHDWGGIATYAAMALHPATIRRAAVVGVGHPSTFPTTVLHPRQVHYIFHFWFFQVEELAAGAVRATDLAYVDYLWDHWSAAGHDDREHIARVKRETLSPEGRLEAALGYYPALLNLPRTDPETAQRMQGEITVPTLAIFGDADPPRELSAGEDVHFSAGYRFELVEGGAHFVHRERPDAVSGLVVDWLASDDLESDADSGRAPASAPGASEGPR
jgi:pimeloyl-ACP methyl ester carboxylesterase